MKQTAAQTDTFEALVQQLRSDLETAQGHIQTVREKQAELEQTLLIRQALANYIQGLLDRAKDLKEALK